VAATAPRWPASKGKLPKQALRQFTPPMAVVNNLNPKLTMEPSIIVPPDVKLPDCPTCANYGDPLAKIGPLSNGPGSGGGIGSRFGRRRRFPVRAAVSAPAKVAVWAAASSA